jgi:hypothetical protein
LTSGKINFYFAFERGIRNNQFGYVIMKEVHILPSEKTPEIYLSPEGTIRIQGRGLSVNRTHITDQILEWLDLYLENPAEVTYVSITFEYLNSHSTSTLFTMLKKITQVMLQSKKLVIKWFYEEDDEDILERGEYIASALNIPIEFLVTHKDQDN